MNHKGCQEPKSLVIIIIRRCESADLGQRACLDRVGHAVIHYPGRIACCFGNSSLETHVSFLGRHGCRVAHAWWVSSTKLYQCSHRWSEHHVERVQLKEFACITRRKRGPLLVYYIVYLSIRDSSLIHQT